MGDRLLEPRKINRERGPFSFFRIQSDVASALFHDAVDGGQTEAGTFIPFLRGEEGLEYLRLDLWVYTGSCVGDAKHYVGPWSRAWVIVRVGGIEVYVGGLNE